MGVGVRVGVGVGVDVPVAKVAAVAGVSVGVGDVFGGSSARAGLRKNRMPMAAIRRKRNVRVAL